MVIIVFFDDAGDSMIEVASDMMNGKGSGSDEIRSLQYRLVKADCEILRTDSVTTL